MLFKPQNITVRIIQRLAKNPIGVALTVRSMRPASEGQLQFCFVSTVCRVDHADAVGAVFGM